MRSLLTYGKVHKRTRCDLLLLMKVNEVSFHFVQSNEMCKHNPKVYDLLKVITKYEILKVKYEFWNTNNVVP